MILARLPTTGAANGAASAAPQADEVPSPLHPVPSLALPALATARLVEVYGNGQARIRIGTVELDATLDPSLHPAVVRTALARGERVLVEGDGKQAWTVLGALRTAPTPGIDEADEYVIKAQRVRVETSGEFTVVAGAASFAVRAYGYVETLAEQITSRASSLHRVVGRVLHLN